MSCILVLFWKCIRGLGERANIRYKRATGCKRVTTVGCKDYKRVTELEDTEVGGLELRLREEKEKGKHKWKKRKDIRRALERHLAVNSLRSGVLSPAHFPYVEADLEVWRRYILILPYCSSPTQVRLARQG